MSCYVFGTKAGNGAETTKDHAYQSFKCNVLDSNEFRRVARGPLGDGAPVNERENSSPVSFKHAFPTVKYPSQSVQNVTFEL